MFFSLFLTENHFPPAIKLFLCAKLTYECLFFIISTEPVAPGEESVRICGIKPAKVAQIHAQTHLERGREAEKTEADTLKALPLLSGLGPDTLVAKAAAFA